ncbi:serine/threonine protein kinase [bacterium]|nr:serine/threonine protein kinase [bacterium]
MTDQPPAPAPAPVPVAPDPDLSLGLLAIRNEFVNLSELKHCLDVRRKQFEKQGSAPELGEVLVEQRYLTQQDLEYLNMIRSTESTNSARPPSLQDIEAEFQSRVAAVQPGAEFGRYEIKKEIGRGGMGVVFLVHDKERDEPAALKLLIGKDQAAVRDIERFKKEATVMMPLDHSGIVRIFEVSREKGLDFISMEFVEGKNLKDLVADGGPMDAAEALRIIRSAAEAVAFIHTQGIIHRDIKPENIMVRPDGTAVIMDFGLAGWDKIEVLAGRGSIGTPMYQPPEQADVGGPFGKITETSDVYGLGATLYFLLTARHPFIGKTVKEVRDKIKKEPPDPPRSLNPKVPQVAEAICLRCLKKRQDHRFQKPKDLIEGIDQVLPILEPDGPKKRPSKTGMFRKGTGLGLKAAAAAKSPAGAETSPSPNKKSEPIVKAKKSTGEVATRGSSDDEPAAGSGEHKLPKRSGGRRATTAMRSAAEETAVESKKPIVIVALIAVVVIALIVAAVAMSSK